MIAASFAVALLLAWQLAFLCDDAFITFRYVANAHEGHGLVWNRAPFAPVEGYTGFAWALLLWAVWSWLGVEPPDAANWLSAAFGVAQLAAVAVAALRLRARDGSRSGDAVALCAIAVVATNRTFVQWLTSGLETALFNLAFVGWVLLALAGAASARCLAAWSAAAALAALTRPDGLLLAAATAAVAGLDRARARRSTASTLVGLLPLLAVGAHVAWRRAFYGEWLPNTYHAKVLEPWPEAGARYVASFAVEHGTWLVAAVALVWLAVEHARDPRFLLRAVARRTAATAAVAACAVHAGYYVWKVGGDHFEYRVLSQLVPLLVLATAAMTLRIGGGARAAAAAVLALGLASVPGWLHYALTAGEPAQRFVPVAAHVPAPLRPLARWYDRQQAWLLFHNVCVRCTHHDWLLTGWFLRMYPERRRVVAPPDPFPMLAAQGVGVVGWSVPDVAVLDLHGLNDWVIARTPVHGTGPALTRDFLRGFIAAANADGDRWLDRAEIERTIGMLAQGGGDRDAGQQLIDMLLAIHARERTDALTLDEAERISAMLLRARSMAHERHPPPGYVDAWDPNVEFAGDGLSVRPRQVPLTADRVRAIEADWRQRVRDGTVLR